jgi:putative aldouronate transport system substrate-binding protein
MGGFSKVVVLLCVCLGLLTGCGKDNSAEVGTPKNPYKIIWYSFGEKPKDFDKVQKKINEYLREKIGIEINMIFPGMEAYNQKMQIVEASGEAYDLTFTCSWTNDYRVAANKGYLLPINDLLQKYGQGILKVLNPAFLEGTKVNGKNYAVPVNKEVAYQHVYKFNKKYVDKYKFDISKIKSIEDLEPMLKIIEENEPGIVPFVPLNYYLFGDMDFILEPTIPGAVKINGGDHKVINQFETEEMIKQMECYRKYYLQGYIPMDAAQRKGVDFGLIKSGKWFCTVDGYQPLADSIWSREYGFPVVSVPTFTPPIIGSISVAGAMIGISSTSERPDLAMKFLNFLNTDKHLRNLIGYGIEGVHFNKIGENRIELTPAADNYFIPQYVIGNLFITYLLPEDPKDKWEQFKAWNDSAVKSPILGFTFDTEPVKLELTAVKNISAEYSRGLYLGARDPKTDLPKMVKKLKEVGLDKILAEMQKQLDEWWSKNHKGQ